MRLVFYAHMASLGNGGTESLLAIVSQLSKNHNCIVITPIRGEFNEELSKRNIKNQVLSFNWSSKSKNVLDFKLSKKNFNLIIDWLKNYKKNRENVKVHSEFLKQFKPDIVYTNTSVINIGYYVAKKLSLPHVWHLREFPDNLLAPNFGWWHFNYLLKKSSAIIVNSNILKSFYKKLIPSTKLNMVYNGIEINNSINRNKYGSPYRFLMVGRLMENKGQIKAVLAAKKLCDKGYEFKLDFVGAGDLEKALRRLIKDLNIKEIVKIHGVSSNISDFYKKADCYLMCSQKEAFGRVTVEAMMHQLPVICKLSEFNAAREIVRANIDGVFYENDDELNLKMEYMLNNKTQGLKMGLAGRERAIKVFSLHQSVENIEKLLREL